MAYKERSKPTALVVLESLDQRMTLSPEFKKYYSNHRIGFEGELQGDTHVEKLPDDCLVLNDLQLNHNYTDFQTDIVIISDKTLCLLEVKNYSGTYDYREDVLYANPNFEIANPLLQLRKSKTLLQGMIRKLGYLYKVEAYVVFINPSFQLFQMPREVPYIFVNQFPRFLQQLAKKSSPVTERNKKLAEQLCQLHDKNYRPKNLPAYECSQLTKGIFCPSCFSFAHTDTRKTRVCSKCGYKELRSNAILRSCREYRILFPNQKMKIHDVYEWCGGVYDKQKIRRVLKKNYRMAYHRNGTYYVEFE